MLQDLLSKPTYLVHFDSNYCLYTNVDTSKAFRIGVVVYHIKDDNSKALTTIVDYSKTSIKEGTKFKYPKRSNIKLIIFLSCWLLLVEHQYWPIELEVARLV